jgi:hypothetical protein
MKHTALVLLLSFVAFSAVSQSAFQKAYGGANDDKASALIATRDGGYLMIGSSTGSTVGVLLVKTDSNGILQWSKTYHTSGNEEGRNAVQTADGGYMVTGTASNNKALLLKIKADGPYEWSNSYGINLESGSSVIQMHDKGFVVTGYTGSKSSSLHIYLFRTDSTGTLKWRKRISGGGCCGYGDNGNALLNAADGGYFLLGTVWYQLASLSVTYLVKFSSIDSIQWEQPFLLSGSSSGNSFKRTRDKGFIICGGITNGGYLLKADSLGNYQWAKSYSLSSNTAVSVIQSNDGGFALIGYDSPPRNLFVYKTAVDGTLKWAKRYGDTLGNYSFQPAGLLQNKNNEYIIGGSTNSAGAGQNDFYLVKADSSGQSHCAEFTVSPVVASITVMSAGSTHKDTIGWASACSLLSRPGGTETPLCDFNVGIPHSDLENKATLFPNPTEGNLTINSGSAEQTFCDLYNLQGEMVYCASLRGTSTLELRHLASGLYFVVLRNAWHVKTMKLVIAH